MTDDKKKNVISFYSDNPQVRAILAALTERGAKSEFIRAAIVEKAERERAKQGAK